MTKHHDILIRQAKQDDLDAIVTLYAQISSDTSNVRKDMTIMFDDPKTHCHIMEKDGGPIGMVIFSTKATLSAGHKMVIEELVIDPAMRRQGLGTMLIEHCVTHAKDNKIDCIELTCSLTKTELHSFYEKAGFKHRMRLYSFFPGYD